MNKDYKNLAHFIYGWKREDVKTQNRMIDWLLLFAYYKAHRQQPIIETVQCDEEIADKVSKLRVLGYGTGCVNTMCAGVSTGVCHAPIVQQGSGTPPSRASLHSKPCTPKTSRVTVQTLNFPVCKQSLAFSSCAQLFSPNFCPAFSFCVSRKKEKARQNLEKNMR